MRLWRDMSSHSFFTKHLLFSILLVMAFHFLLLDASLLIGAGNIERYRLKMLENDILTIYLSPPVENLSARCTPITQNGVYSLSIATKYLDPYVMRMRREVSAVWIQPTKPGIYNLTIRFFSNQTWEYLLGVYSRNYDFYSDYYGKRVEVNKFFVELQDPLSRNMGEWTISILLKVERVAAPSSIFSSIKLPTPVNFAIFMAVLGLMAYMNSFLIIDTYFKSRRETISRSRWILVALVAFISILIAYQLYGFMIQLSSTGS